MLLVGPFCNSTPLLQWQVFSCFCQTTNLALIRPLFKHSFAWPPLGLAVRMHACQAGGGGLEPSRGLFLVGAFSLEDIPPFDIL